MPSIITKSKTPDPDMRNVEIEKRFSASGFREKN